MNIESHGERTEEFQHPPELLVWKPGTSTSPSLADRVQVWLIELDAGLESEADVETAEPGPTELDLLSSDEQERAARFVRARDRRRFARCRAGARQLLGSLLGQPPATLQFVARGKGKPELDSASLHGAGRRWQDADGRPVIRFNISHSSDVALIAICRGRELGVDVEQVRHIEEASRIVESFFSAAEQAAFAAIADSDRDLAFFRGWTRKEAVLKGLGLGLSGLSANYETGFSLIGLTPQFARAAPRSQVERWQLWEAAPRAGFVAALACEVVCPSLEQTRAARF